MPKINILPKHLAELIAAGEVVERPSSVVKELLENSIDAGSTKITVEIKNGGIRYIRITDNGCGIAREDIEAAFISHATSKISTENDLGAIFTLGFRGEALASVAAVSHVETLTKTPSEEIGTRYAISGGVREDIDDAGCPDGTTIIIRDLFYNTPARMKFLKKDSTEGSYVSEVIAKIALSHPEIGITFIKDNRRALFTPGDGELITVIKEVYGKEFAAGLIEASGETEGIKVRGYISKPVFSRANRTMQHTFVNGRYVKIPAAASALDNAYKNSVMTGKYPACILFLEINPSAVDVNVHPAKTQVRFSNEKSVYDAIYFAAVSALRNGDTPVRVETRAKSNFTPFSYGTKSGNDNVRQPNKISLSISYDEADINEKTVINANAEAPPLENMYKGIKRDFSQSGNVKNMVFHRPKAPFFRSEAGDYSGDVLNMRNETDEKADAHDTEENRAVYERKKIRETENSESRTAQESVTSQGFGTIKEIGEIKNTETIPENEAIRKNREISEDDESLLGQSDFRILGEVFGTYILLEQKKQLVFIDKHAAHERIIFNELKNRERKTYSQLLLSPVTVTLSARDYVTVIDNLELFRKSGYGIDDFGEGTVRVTETPTELSGEDVNEIVLEAADRLSKNAKEPESDKLDWLYHSTACRAAVKAGDDISLSETESLVRRVLNDKNIRYCPHGRPVMFTMSEYEIKKLFGRNG